MNTRFYTNVAVSGDDILVREINERGKQVKRRVKYRPTIFYEATEQDSRRSDGWTTIFGEPVIAQEFPSIKSARKYIERLEAVDGFKVYGLQKFQYTWLNEEYPDKIEFDQSLLRIGSIDIETMKDETGYGSAAEGDKPITLITCSIRNFNNVIHTFGWKPFDNQDPGVRYHQCDTEEDMLRLFLDFWEEANYDVITSWNGELYDIPYIINRIMRLLGEDQAKRLSPWRMLRNRQVDIYGKPTTVWTIVGISHLDYYDLYRKFVPGEKESFKLDHIAFVELGEKKLDYSEFKDLQDLYERDYDRYVRYNIKDVRLVDKIDDKKRLITLALTIAYMTKINFVDALTTVTLWDIFIHNYLWSKKMVVPPLDPDRIDRSIEGAFVKDPVPGYYRNVVSFDVESLYPSLIIQYNISPETYIGRISLPSIYDIVYHNAITADIQKMIKEKDVCLCATGLMFSRSKKGFLPTLIDQVFSERKLAKNEMLRLEGEASKADNKEIKEALLKEAGIFDVKQGSYKVLINGLYGALANYMFRWYMADFAESVTKSGQMSIRFAERSLNEYLTERFGPHKHGSYVIAIDTDSSYVDLGSKFDRPTIPESIDAINQFAEQDLKPVIKSCFGEMAEVTNAYINRVVMKREVIADQAIWTGKKHYALRVWDKEGVPQNPPKLKIMGLEAVKSSTALAAREGIKGAILCMFEKSQEELFDFVDDFYYKFTALSVEELAKPTSVRGLMQYANDQNVFIKGTPYHVKASLIYNKLLKDKGLENTFEPIVDGDKVKIINLKMPNPVGVKTIAFKGFLPEELGIYPYIDFHEQYEKMFLKPVTPLAQARGWHAERLITVDDAF